MILVFIVNSVLVVLAVITHYKFLHLIVKAVPALNIRHSFRIVVGVFGALIAHVVEIWVFAVAYYFKHHAAGWGSLKGNFDGSLLDCVYFSFTVYTTVGFGDIEPIGNIRYLTGIESLTGLVLITWTASFLYYEMQKHWQNT